MEDYEPVYSKALRQIRKRANREKINLKKILKRLLHGPQDPKEKVN